MARRMLLALAVILLVDIATHAQAPEGYLDVFIVKVKPEKRAEFDAIAKKIADANRRHKGDNWVAAETAYGESNTIYFTTTRANYAEVEKGSEMFMGALTKAYGQAGANKMFQDLNNCIVSSRGELRRRRLDLSSNAPADTATLNKVVGSSRWVRTTIVRIRPGRAADYEARLRENKAASERTNPGTSAFISQSAAGQQGTVFYISILQSSLGGFDSLKPLSQTLGEDGYQRYMKTVSEAVLSTETMINRFLPEISNPPESVASAAPKFWNPKPAPAPKATTESGKKQ